MSNDKNIKSVSCSCNDFASGESANFMATCPKGVEYVLANEMRALGASDVSESIAAVYFSATREQAWYICLWTRVASRIVLLLAKGVTHSADDLQQQVQSLRWSDWFTSEKKIAIDFNGSNQFIRNNRFGAQLCKDAISDQFVELGEPRLQVELTNPDILIYTRLFKNRFSIGFDLAGESLHRRGYRQQSGAAPIKENLAAALLLMTNWPEVAEKGGAFIDPMCGSGTLLIEAAMMALKLSPSAHRDYWLLENLQFHDAKQWRHALDEAQKPLNDGDASALSVTGFDINQKTLSVAQSNISAAGLQDVIELRQVAVADLNDATKGESGLVLTNPPYGKRLGEHDDLQTLYADLGAWLKRDCLSWQAAVFTGNPELGWSTGLRSWRQHRLFNGAIACELQRYKIEPDSFRAENFTPKKIVVEDTLSEHAQMLCNRLRKNQRRLSNWLKQSGEKCYRLYDADLPDYAVAIDVYQGTLLDTSKKNIWGSAKEQLGFHLQEYAPPRTIEPRLAEKRLKEVEAVIKLVFDTDDSKVFVKQRRQQRGKQQYEKSAKRVSDMVVSEGGYQFIVNLGNYLDTGIFLDHRLVRREIAGLAKGKRFLNLFSYTASASVYAAKAGARSSMSVDMSNTYQRWARRNFELNGLSLAQHQTLAEDCLQWLDDHDKQYDLILLDPPSFSNSNRMEQTLDIQRDHVSLLEKCMRLLAPEGVLIFSNNRKGFKLAPELEQQYAIENISKRTCSPDFKQKGGAHQCWRLQLKPSA